MKLKFKLIVAALSLSTFVTSQNAPAQDPSSSGQPVSRKKCGTASPPKAWDAWFNQKVEERRKSAARETNIYSITIPVIVHLIHRGTHAVGQGANLTQAQVNSQIKILNDDFGGVGYNSGLLANTGFSAVGVANCNITFCMARLHPNGSELTEPGIDRIDYTANGWAEPNTFTTSPLFMGYMDGVVKPNTIWDPTLYFNIWVSDIDPNCSLLGYATFPGGTSLAGITGNMGNSATDGIWVWSKAFGSTGLLDPNYNHGRTATHETGHWLGLRHIGGDATNPAGDCSATDYCDDTPPQKGGYFGGTNGQNFGAPPYPFNPFVCPASPYGDMFMNFMDYTNDETTYMFTPDQNVRIQTALAEGYFRNQLNASSATVCAGLPLADFFSDTLGCMDNVWPINASIGGEAKYTWSVSPGAGVNILPTDTAGNPSINFPSTGTYTISLKASNSIGTTTSFTVMQIIDCTGMKENNALSTKIRMSPNPSSGLLNIQADGIGQNLHIRIHNSLGQLVFSRDYSGTEHNTLQLDLQEFAAGVYTVTFANDQEKIVKRLLLSK